MTTPLKQPDGTTITPPAATATTYTPANPKMDVPATAPANGDLLQWVAASGRPAALPRRTFVAEPATEPATGELLTWNATTKRAVGLVPSTFVPSNGNVGFFGKTPIARAAAITAADATVVAATYDATVVAVIENLRTRVNALENVLKGYGLLP